MPLIILSGYPSSGKTHRAKQILAYFDARIADPSTFALAQPSAPTTKQAPRRNLRTHHISDHTLHIPRSAYATARAEKDARAAIYSAVKRALSADDVVILDGGNYIKGWRYQLFCEAKALGTPCCVVHIGPQEGTADGARKVNDARLAVLATVAKASGEVEGETAVVVGGDGEVDPYDPAVWTELVYRFEEPNPMARWDSPLFTVPWGDAEPPCEQIWEETVEGRSGPVKQNLATVLAPATAHDGLYVLDRTTQIVLAQIQTYQRDHPGEVGGEVSIDVSTFASTATGGPPPPPPSSTTSSKKAVIVRLELPPTPMSTPYLQRLRRQFIALQRTAAGGAGMIGGAGQGVLTAESVGRLFVDWLRDQFWEE